MTIATSDTKTLSKIKGCGKKTAERIIVELRENVSSLDLGELPTAVVAAVSGVEADASIALMSLGFSRQDAEMGIAIAKSQGASTVEEIIAGALKNLA